MKARINRPNRGTGRKKFSIIVDGETEVWYMQMMLKNESWPVNVKPEIPSKKKLEDQYDLVLQNAKDYDKVFWVVDLDVIIKEDNESNKGEKPSQKLKRYIEEAKEYSNVHILINNTCLEYWFLLHFEPTAKVYSKCEDAEKQLKKHLPKYEKTQKYFKNANDIYSILKPNLANAISNASKLGVFDIHNFKSPKAELYLFFKEISVVSGLST